MTIFSEVSKEQDRLMYEDGITAHALLITVKAFGVLSWPFRPIPTPLGGGIPDSYWCGIATYIVLDSWFLRPGPQNFEFVFSEDTVTRALVHAGRVVIPEN